MLIVIVGSSVLIVGETVFDAVGLDVVGMTVVGLDVVGLDVVGMAVVGLDVVGLDVIGMAVVTGLFVGCLDDGSGTSDDGSSLMQMEPFHVQSALLHCLKFV